MDFNIIKGDDSDGNKACFKCERSSCMRLNIIFWNKSLNHFNQATSTIRASKYSSRILS